MSQCWAGLRDSIYIPYLDDILCYGKTLDEHLENLRGVLRRLKKFSVKFEAQKCTFFKKEIKYVGKVIGENRYWDSTINTEVLENPQKIAGNLTELLGFLGYFRKTIWDSSIRTEPLYDILCVPVKNTPSNSMHHLKKTKAQRLFNEKRTKKIKQRE